MGRGVESMADVEALFDLKFSFSIIFLFLI